MDLVYLTLESKLLNYESFETSEFLAFDFWLDNFWSPHGLNPMNNVGYHFNCSISIEKTVLQLNLERVTIHALQWTLSHSWLKIIPPNCKNIIVQHCWSIDLDRQLGISKQNSGPRERKRTKVVFIIHSLNWVQSRRSQSRQQ